MSKYLEFEKVKELNEYRRKIYALREEAYNKTGIDVLDTDTLSSLSIHEVVHQYDSEYNINFARTGEDGKSGDVLIEQKATQLKKKKPSGLYGSASFQFHAMGDIVNDRYIFATRDKATLDLIRIYDISSSNNKSIIQQHLFGERQQWEDKNKELGHTQKRDVILLPEHILSNSLLNKTVEVINNCEVVRA